MKKPIPFGKYYLLERINVGGMAEVFRAKAYGVEGFERLVAVKRILPNIAEDKEFIGMFIDEAKIAVQLNHANIAQIFDLGMVDGAYYIALEHIHGRDLRAIFDRCRESGKAMPIAQAAFVIMKVCEGLDYAHNKRDQSGRELDLVHRDVSPQNILVSFEGEVKLIDFGIAKAAGQGAQTQAGILKGKFGYMSPEQVRGLPIDRRTDIFSCGIVLYELLTGERLFVGESDFSTLEKVRNVEILPPSTYNRRIPDELERIVLKALAKDVEERYQQAIDLHDDLQAFVYTAGEFYSRKDLAAWMKDTFAREIEEETAKLESYRQLSPPEQPGAARPSSPTELGRSPLSVSGGPGKLPPPIPTPELMASARLGSPAPGASSESLAAAAPVSSDTVITAASDTELPWDEDEVETQIYDNPPEAPPVAAGRGRAATPTAPLGSRASELQPDSGVSEVMPEDIMPVPGSQVETTRGWDAGPQTPPPSQFPAGSNQSLGSFVEDVAELVDDGQALSPFDVISPGHAQGRPRSRTGLYVAVAAPVVLLVGGGVGGYLLLEGSDDREAVAATADRAVAEQRGPVQPDPADSEPGEPGEALDKEVLARTGFNLIVEPKEAKVELDGEVLKLKPPMKVRNIQPGEHELVIHGPPGFFSKNQTISVQAGEAELVTVRLDPLEIAARFTSDPPGAEVTLIVDGDQEIELGRSPATYKLDPRSAYRVRFEKRGYEDRVETVSISGGTEEVVAVELRRSSRSRSDSEDRGRRRSSSRRSSGKSSDADRADKGQAAAPGTLMLGSKPPCRIFIDGRDTGKDTPERDLSLPAGRHRVMLVNKEHGIREKFTVTIRPGQTVKRIKDFTDRLE